MGIKSNFTKQDIQRALMIRANQFDKAIVSRFVFVGETFVNNARANGTYMDQTGNLRSGICYVVFKDGIKRSPGAISPFSKKLIEELKLNYLKGYVLIVATGLDYAAAVESRGKDVLTASSITARKDLQIAFKSFKNLA